VQFPKVGREGVAKERKKGYPSDLFEKKTGPKPEQEGSHDKG
jgi:hypothetical protein